MPSPLPQFPWQTLHSKSGHTLKFQIDLGGGHCSAPCKGGYVVEPNKSASFT